MIDFIAFTELNCSIVFRTPYAKVRTPRTEILEFTRILIRPRLYRLMSKHSFTKWLLLVAFQLLFGAAVFTITRAYYLYQPTLIPVTQAPKAQSATPGSRLTALVRSWVEIVVPGETQTIEDPVRLAKLGDQLFEQREYGRAVVAYERAVLFNPQNVESYNDLGLTLLYLGQTEKAVQVLQDGIGRDPNLQRIQLTMGFVQAQLGNFEAAATALYRAVELDPDTTEGVEAKKILAQIQQRTR